MGERIDIQSEQARLKSLTMRELHDEHVRVVGWRHTTSNRSTLTRRILWHLRYGPLSPEVVARAREIAAQVLVKEIPPVGWPGVPEAPVREPVRDPRLPMPGTTLARKFRGETVEVRVLERGFEWRGEVFPSLSAVAAAISGSHVNGFRFFRLDPKEKQA
jgi:hypothetical protein